MSLPKLDVAIHDTIIPSTKKKLKIRPFLVKEQKILLTAMTGNNTEDMTNAIKQIVNNCVVTPGFDVDKLELFDLEYLMLQLRIISVGETTKLRFLPREGVTCSECSTHREVSINLKEVNVDFSSSKDKKIELTENIGLIMRYPSTKTLNKLEKTSNSTNIDDIFGIIWSCIESIYDSEKLTSSKDVSNKESMEFLESLNGQQFAKIEEFISSIPKLKHKIHIKCSECDFEQDYIIEGLDNFFG